jgi:hypothetical protein
VELWSCGAVELWSCGAVELWSCGAVELCLDVHDVAVLPRSHEDRPLS